MLSILLPVYKCSCVALVTELQRQCMECGIAYEIIVADDGTMADKTNQYIVERNKGIGQLEARAVYYKAGECRSVSHTQLSFLTIKG